MILVGNWKVELDFRVLAPTSIYAHLATFTQGGEQPEMEKHTSVQALLV